MDPQMLERRKTGKTAFMIMDKLIVDDQKLPDNGRSFGVPVDKMMKMALLPTMCEKML